MSGKWQDRKTLRCWSIIYPDGHILLDSKFEDESMAWQVALGWPDISEIEHAKATGYRSALVTVIL